MTNYKLSPEKEEMLFNDAFKILDARKERMEAKKNRFVFHLSSINPMKGLREIRYSLCFLPIIAPVAIILVLMIFEVKEVTGNNFLNLETTVFENNQVEGD